jgi:hypothetical protein
MCPDEGGVRERLCYIAIIQMAAEHMYSRDKHRGVRRHPANESMYTVHAMRCAGVRRWAPCLHGWWWT